MAVVHSVPQASESNCVGVAQAAWADSATGANRGECLFVAELEDDLRQLGQTPVV